MEEVREQHYESPSLPAGLARRPGGGLLVAVAKQAFYEHVLLRRKGIRFRSSAPSNVRAAYAAMTPGEFDAINARQQWANWRVIPKNLQGRVDGPLAAVDLCCGTGHSSEVLLRCLPEGSTVLGFDASADLIHVARTRVSANGNGSSPARFAVQSVLDPFRWPGGRLVERDEIGLVNSSGAVGCHFEPHDTLRLAREVRRVLQPNGLALIDAGPGGTSPGDLVAIYEDLGFQVLGRARSCPFDRYWQFCFRADRG